MDSGSTSRGTTEDARTPVGCGIVASYLIGSSAHGGGVIPNGSVGVGAGGVTNSEDAGAACVVACGASSVGWSDTGSTMAVQTKSIWSFSQETVILVNNRQL